ncbi:hypothetical protein ACHAXT_007766 [Thalassiosira profunda]
MDRDRVDVAVKDLLSQLSRDETVVEEVRKIALRGLKGGKEPTQDQDAPRVATPADDAGASGQASSSKSITSTQHKGKSTRQAMGAEDGEELAFTIDRDSDTYKSIFSTVQWYRDQFMIGTDFADRRSAERKGGNTHSPEVQSVGESVMGIIGSQTTKRSDIPLSDPTTAMAHPLLLSSAESYVRSVAAVDLLRPYATWIASKDGPLFHTATQSLAQTIPLGQSSCDWAMRENLLWVLKDEEWREFAKSITTKYVDRSYKDG